MNNMSIELCTIYCSNLDPKIGRVNQCKKLPIKFFLCVKSSVKIKD